MTREEAITKIFKKYDVPTSNPFFFEIIKALEQEHCEDAISRQAVIDLINADWKYEGLEVSVNSLPPVNPQPCEDAISRQATIEAFQMFRGYEANRTNAEWVDRIETIVKKLPPVNPQEPCDKCEVGNPCLYCKHEFETQERSEKE